MNSPFPGMDPYLERRWQEVHQRVCTYACDAIETQLGADLVARLGERLVVESITDDTRTIYPGVRVVEQGVSGSEWTPSTAGGGAVVAEPLIVKVAADPVPQAFIEIREADSSRLITVIEFLSPSNKLPGDGRDTYRQKQRELYAAQVSLVEIDLVRIGTRTFLLPESHFPTGLNATYFACVFRGWNRSRFELYPMSLRETLATIRVPLRRNEPDVVLNIQELIDEAYRKGRYDRTDYRQPCVPPLSGDDAAWAQDRLKVAGRI